MSTYFIYSLYLNMFHFFYDRSRFFISANYRRFIYELYVYFSNQIKSVSFITLKTLENLEINFEFIWGYLFSSKSAKIQLILGLIVQKMSFLKVSDSDWIHFYHKNQRRHSLIYAHGSSLATLHRLLFLFSDHFLIV